MPEIKVLIADDIEEIRDYFSTGLNQQEGIQVIGTASSGTQAVELAKHFHPDLLLMDIQMETRCAGIDAIEEIHSIFPDIKCIVLTIHENDEFLFRAYLAGASDYIVKTSPIDHIVRSIHAVMDNKLLLNPDIARRVMSTYRQVQEDQKRTKETLQVMMMISAAEYEILRMVYSGCSYRDIAERRCVQESTIRSQVNHILKKFGKKRMKEIIAQLRELNLFEGG